MKQTIVKGFEAEGFKTQIQPLSHFQEAYGLEGDGEEDDEEAEEDYDEVDASEAGSEEED